MTMPGREPNASWATLRRTLARLQPYPWHVIGCVVAFAAAGATVIALGQGVRNLLDVGLHGTSAALAGAVGVLLLLVALYGASALGRVYLSGFLAERVATNLR